MDKNNNYEEKLNAEIEKRISEMEQSDYVFPKRFGKRDYIILAAVAAVCLVMIIVGAYI
ncbi:MAG: hypothetical protein ACI4JF_09160 [Oscillospiraceae bacterium]